jgi:hypothetical protein
MPRFVAPLPGSLSRRDDSLPTPTPPSEPTHTLTPPPPLHPDSRLSSLGALNAPPSTRRLPPTPPPRPTYSPHQSATFTPALNSAASAPSTPALQDDVLHAPSAETVPEAYIAPAPAVPIPAPAHPSPMATPPVLNSIPTAPRIAIEPHTPSPAASPLLTPFDTPDLNDDVRTEASTIPEAELSVRELRELYEEEEMERFLQFFSAVRFLPTFRLSLL